MLRNELGNTSVSPSGTSESLLTGSTQETILICTTQVRSFANGGPSTGTVSISAEHGKCAVAAFAHSGVLNHEALELSLEEALRRYRHSNPQLVASPDALDRVMWQHTIGVVDPSDRSLDEKFLTFIEDEASQPLPSQDRVVRARLVDFGRRDRQVLLVALTEQTETAGCVKFLANELSALYQNYSASKPGDILASAASSGEIDSPYWRNRLARVSPAAELPTDRARPDQQCLSYSRRDSKLSTDVVIALRALGADESAPLAVTVLAALQCLLYRYTAQEDVLIGCSFPVDFDQGSNLKHGKAVISFPFRTSLSAGETFRSVLRKVARLIKSDLEHPVPSTATLAGTLDECDRAVVEHLRILFSVEPQGSTESDRWEIFGGKMAEDRFLSDIQVSLSEHEDQVSLSLRYNAQLIETRTVERVLGHLQKLASEVAMNPDQTLAAYALLNESERTELLSEWNDTRTDYPRDWCVPQLFEEQVSLTPSDTAVAFQHRQLTFSELNLKSNRLAHHLRSLGVAPDDLVGVCVERTPNLLVALLGVLKAGAAYVPLDPQYPAQRLALMIEDSGMRVLVSEDALRERVPKFSGEIVCLDGDAVRKEVAANLEPAAGPENLAYVIYTSGSTGTPKGVEITHRALVNFLYSMRSQPGLTAADTLLAVTTVSFDIAALELYLPLLAGARLVLVARDVAADGQELLKTLEECKPTVMQATPATWRLLLESGWSGSKALKILCGGEGMPRDLAIELLKRCGALWNMYGPTETTVWSTLSRIQSTDAPITIGRPVANTQIYILDGNLEPVPTGVAGELYIGGDGVARGYWRRPELTAERFIQSPFCSFGSSARIYRTGDLARYRFDGEIECLGRIDNQVKVRGFRIELGEIEACLKACPGVKQNVVVAREDNPGDKRLVGYLVVDTSQPPTSGALRAQLGKKLPEYMVPALFVVLDRLPLTPNGKIDRKALPAPSTTEVKAVENGVRDRTPIEAQLLAIWESILHVRVGSTEQSFFDLGGHSILVAKLVRRVEQEFGTKLSMAALFEAPTIARQALLVDGQKTSSWPCAIVPVQPSGSREPLFCFGFGAGPIFLPLARRLGADQPVFAVDPTLLPEQELHAPYRMRDVAALLAKQIREMQPKGPYHLTGFCGGGLIAYATATELVASGQRVGLLAMFEPHSAYKSQRERPEYAHFATRLRQKAAFHIGNIYGLGFNEARNYLVDRVGKRIRLTMRDMKNTAGRDAGRAERQESSPTNIHDVLQEAYREYQPEPFWGRAVLFQATHREPGSEWERTAWQNLAPDLRVHEISGYSNWLVRFFAEPTVADVSRMLAEYFPAANNKAAHTSA